MALPDPRNAWRAPTITLGWPERLRLNLWDVPAFALVLGALILLTIGGAGMSTPYDIGDPLDVTLDPHVLPYYALRSVLRMFAALALSISFSFIVAIAAARSRRAEKLIVPMLDVLQSVPVLSFLTITVTGFIALFPGSLLGVECASIFAVFTSQAWNIAFSLYQSFITVPKELREAARTLHLGAWKSFWRLDVPFAMPGLIWNMMASMSGGWFFVVASEAITVSDQTILLPGIGSYISVAIQQKDLGAIAWAIGVMFVVILAYDQLLFRPLLAWAEKFKPEGATPDILERPWFLTMLQKARLAEAVRAVASWIYRGSSRSLRTVRALVPLRAQPQFPPEANTSHDRRSIWVDRGWDALLLLGALAIALKIGEFVRESVPGDEIVQVFFYGALTALRVFVLVAIASVVWVPIGVYIGLRPAWARRAQPIFQFLAAFPANLFYPIAVAGIVYFHLNDEIWLSPLMVLGTQWYIAFNVIGGASALPRDLQLVADNLHLPRWLWWRKFIIPGILPAYVTGAVTAAGGAWNAAIVSEIVTWGDIELSATGIGAYIGKASHAGDFPRLWLGTAVLCVYVIVFNRTVWRRLYEYAAERSRLD
ncbi:ABC transporter permease [Roseiterribacter gracilis]|uniref:ABC transporter permease n=1 Tax=Roseiterribacter gracilis TaxID=2812848 RepID=A0A8S8X8E9_9PROT|nr:ABC transporter permease [Rhodospirillales bacterium TMPK1]